MPVVLVLTAVVILAGVVVVAVGRGGELATFRPDVRPPRRGLASAADLAAFRPPLAFFGYSAQVTDDALRRIAGTVAAKDAELAALRGELAALRGEPSPQDPRLQDPSPQDASPDPGPGAGGHRRDDDGG